MIRRNTKPLSVVVWTVYLLLAVAGEGFGVQPCAFHGRGSHDAAGGHHAHDAHADHGDGGHTNPSPQAGADHEAPSDVCTHVDGCPVATAAIGVRQVPEFSAVTEPAPRPTYLGEDHREAFPEFFLPYPNAPPALG